MSEILVFVRPILVFTPTLELPGPNDTKMDYYTNIISTCVIIPARGGHYTNAQESENEGGILCHRSFLRPKSSTKKIEP